jgi:hypothetical protein
LSVLPFLAAHSFIAGKSPKVKRLPSFIFDFFCNTTFGTALTKRAFLLVKKFTDFVIPVFPHLWRTKRGVRQAVIRGINVNGSLRAPTPPLPPPLLGLHFRQRQCHTACKPTAAAAAVEGLQPWRFSFP